MRKDLWLCDITKPANTKSCFCFSRPLLFIYFFPSADAFVFICSCNSAAVRNVIWSRADEANVVLGVKATVTKEQSRSGRTSRHGTRLTFRQHRAALEVTKCPGNGIFFGWGGRVWKRQSWGHGRYRSLVQNKSPNNHADARPGNFRRFPTWPRRPVTIATYSLTSSPMKHRFRSSPAHSCTPTMPKMKKTKKHSASTLPSIGSVSKSRVTRMRMPTNTHRTKKKKQAPDESLS